MSEGRSQRYSDHGLSQNEARVLHSLIKWPDYTDHAVHSQIGMKKSTFSSIKTRLKESDYFSRYYVPNFPKIDLELLIVMHGHLNRFTTIEERMRVAENLLKSFVEDFHIASESNMAFNLSASENLTEYTKNQEKFIQLYSENKFLDKQGMTITYYPFEISKIRAFMDYESMVARVFGFVSDPYEKRKTIPSGKVPIAKMTKAEKKVFAGIVQYPEESDTFIAEKVEVSRNTVANAKRKFLNENICFPRAVPNLKKLGFKILVFTAFKYNPKISEEMENEAAEMVRHLLAPFFFVSKNLDGFLISSHRSFEEYKAANEEMMRFYTRTEFIIEEPISYQMTIDNINFIKNYDFLPLSLKILGYDEFGKEKETIKPPETRKRRGRKSSTKDKAKESNHSSSKLNG